MSDERVLGSGGFVESVLKNVESRESLRGRIHRREISLEILAKRVAENAGLEEKALLTRGRTAPVSRAKAVLIFIATEYLGKTGQEMAQATHMSAQAASQARWRGKGFVTKEDIGKLID